VRSFHTSVTFLRDKPDEQAECVTEGLYGEDYIALNEVDHQWQLIRLIKDGYEGFIEKPENTDHVDTNYRINRRSSLLFARPSIKSKVTQRLPFNAELGLVDHANTEFLETTDGLYIWKDHVSPLKVSEAEDPVTLALENFLGAPYSWGGRTPAGADCSGMVQAVLQACGHELPRDSHDQERALSYHVPLNSRQRGDIVFWPGHVGLLLNPDELIHSTAFSLDCCTERLDAVIERAGPISSIKRCDFIALKDV